MGRQPQSGLLFGNIFSEKCMKMKETGPSVPPDPQSNNQVEMAPAPPIRG